jgi:hypothetical protein
MIEDTQEPCDHRTGDGRATAGDLAAYTPGDACPSCRCTLGADGYWYADGRECATGTVRYAVGASGGLSSTNRARKTEP